MNNGFRLSFAAIMLCILQPFPASADMTPLDKYTYLFCMELVEHPGADAPGPASERMMLRRVFEPMDQRAADIGVSPEAFFVNHGCEARYIGGRTASPYIHLVADNATARLKYMVSIRKHYLDVKKRPDAWHAIVNAKNSKGMTVLDYVDYAITNHKYLAMEAQGIAAFISFVCASGGGYATSPKRCPPGADDSAQGILARLGK